MSWKRSQLSTLLRHQLTWFIVSVAHPGNVTYLSRVAGGAVLDEGISL